MKETVFIQQNKEKWSELESLIDKEDKDPERLSQLFVQVADDLSYSRTYYKNRSVRLYLNTMSRQVFLKLFRNKKQTWQGIRQFWTDELPLHLYHARKQIYLSAGIFFLFFAIGVLSAYHDPEFPAKILGDDYVKMTEQNIAKGDPMAVYKADAANQMFLHITLNNIYVITLTFLLGVFFMAGTGFITAYNGVMIGAFQYYFIHKGLFTASFLTIWLHGTLEISGIIIGAAAGITMGRGLVFPGTYSRGQAFLISARRGFKVLAAAIPIIVMAAIIESFLTRHTEAPDALRLGLIIFSAAFAIYYFVVYPGMRFRKSAAVVEELLPYETMEEKVETNTIKDTGEVFHDVMVFYRSGFKRYLKITVILSALVTLSQLLITSGKGIHDLSGSGFTFLKSMFNYEKNDFLFLINSVWMALLFYSTVHVFSGNLSNGKPMRFYSLMSLRGVSQLVWVIVSMMLVNLVFYVNIIFTILLIVLVVPFFIEFLFIMFYERKTVLGSIQRVFDTFFIHTMQLYGVFSLMFIGLLMYFWLLSSPLFITYFQFVEWNLDLSIQLRMSVVNSLMSFSAYLAMGLLMPMLFCSVFSKYFSQVEILEAVDLKRKVKALSGVIQKGRRKE
jgi:uncharacterized membrane protein SpoIIM required for sporulation